MKIILVMLIFCLTLFFYLHVFFHIKTSNDLEIFDIEQPSKDKLEEVCDLRQPVRMQFANDTLENTCQLSNIASKYQCFDVNIRNVKEIISHPGDAYAPLRLNNVVNVIKNDTEKKYIVESNAGFLDETGMNKIYRDADSFIRPYMTVKSKYDYLTGSNGVQSPFRYDINYRNYLIVVSGSARVKLAPPKSTKYLHPIKDYYNFEFRSPIDPWNVQEEFSNDFDKIKCLDVDIYSGQLFFIPAYWWYSIEFGDNTVLASFKYDSLMSLLSTAPHYGIYFLQSHNVKRVYPSRIDEKDEERNIEDTKNRINTEKHDEPDKQNHE